MPLRAAPLALATLVVVAGCAQQTRPVVARALAPTRAPAGWRAVVTRGDMARLHGWRTAFVAALGQARAGGFSAAVAREGALLQPDAALPDVAMADGRYRCRTIKLGAKGAGNLPFVAYPAFDCAVTGGITRFAKLGGSQRPVGRVFDADARRKIFVGTLILGDERRPLSYGRDGDRDMVGAFERIGERRWRLILPYPRFESLTDILELVPAT